MCLINEYNTSKKCANCFSNLKKYDPKKEEALDSTKYSICPLSLEQKNNTARKNKQHKHVIHHDQKVSRNITMLLELKIDGIQDRPEPFTRKSNEFNCKITNFSHT